MAANNILSMDFSPYGQAYDLSIHSEDGSSVRASGDGWSCASTPGGIAGERACLGYVESVQVPVQVFKLERHMHTSEAIFAVSGPVVFAAAPPNGREQPDISSVEAVLLPPGTVAVLSPGVWHSPCFGVDGPGKYFYMSSQEPSPSGDAGSPWADITGGPVSL